MNTFLTQRYQSAQTEVRALLETIEHDLRAHDVRYAGSESYGALGDLGYVREMLANVHEFIRP